MATTNKVSLKLLIDRKGERVLFAEAGKDFVDFLFHIFSLHFGAVSSLLTKKKMVDCLGKLYGSIESLNNTYLQPSANKDSVLNLKTPGYSIFSNAPLLLPGGSSLTGRRTLYSCNSNRGSYYPCFSVADDPKAIFSICNQILNTELTFMRSANVNAIALTGDGGGYVKGVVTYMIMDDLQVKPMPTISSVMLLNTFNVHDLRALEEKVVYLTMDEGLKILKASPQSETVLSDVFLPKKKQ